MTLPLTKIYLQLHIKTIRFNVAVVLRNKKITKNAKMWQQHQRHIRHCMPGSLFLSHFDVTCDQSLDKCMEKWILFVDQISKDVEILYVYQTDIRLRRKIDFYDVQEVICSLIETSQFALGSPTFSGRLDV